jgi:malonyl-CoA O-methyltransferase
MQVSVLEAHRIWAPIYESGANPVRALARRTVRSLLTPLRPLTVIDVACGTGEELLDFQKSGSVVFGCDACQEMLDEAGNKPLLRGRVVLADSEWLPFQGAVADLVLCSLSLGYFQNINRVFAEFKRIAKADGVVAVSDLHPQALDSGWTRSFRAGAEVYEIDHYRRSLEEISDAALWAGLRPKLSREVRFGDGDFDMFRAAGKAELFENARRVPALFIGLWENPLC